METQNRLPLVVRIMLPFVMALLVPFSPLPEDVREDWLAARQAARSDLSRPAADGFERAAQMYPWRADLWEQAAIWQAAAGRLTRAEFSFKQAQMAGGVSPAGVLARADLWLQMGRPADAVAEFQHLSALPGLPETIYRSIAERLLQARDWTAYATALNTWQTSYPGSSEALYALGQWLYIEQPAGALRLLQQAAGLNPALQPAVDQMQQALDEWAENDDQAFRLVLQGQALGRVGSWRLAQLCFERAVQTAPDYAEAWALLGEARQQNGQDGKPDLDRALTLNPQSQIGLALAAQYWRRQNKPQEALPYLAELRRLYPDQAIWYAETGAALAAGGDLIEAYGYYQQAVQVQPDNATAWRLLAAFSVEYGVDVRTVGLPAARRAVVLAPEDARAVDVLGWTLLNLGDRVTAERILQRAARLDGADNSIRYHLGQLYYLRGMPDIAEQYLRAVLASTAPNDALNTAAARILRRMGR